MHLLKPLALICALSLAACAADADEAGTSTSDVITGDTAEGAELVTTANLNLRAEAALDAEVIVTMKRGETVTALEASPSGEFYHVQYGETSGWASGRYLKRANGTPLPPPKTPAAEEPAPEPSGEFNGRTYSGVTMLWQGNWDFLMQCDSYSRNNGGVLFYCGPAASQSFVDDEAWVAVPSGSMTKTLCNTKARVCKGDRCIVATVVERSVTASRWEGSTAVLSALGVATSFKSCKSSQGTATGVTITLE